jgi:hypothetical protein
VLLQAVLKGIFPVVIVGAAATALWLRRLRRPLAALRIAAEDPASQNNLRAVYRFNTPQEVSGLRKARAPQNSR